MTFRYDSFCGLYCGACDALMATKAGTVDQLAEEVGKEGTDLVCRGCKSDVNAVYCTSCQIKECAEGKDVEFCFECDEYPCATLRAFQEDEHDHHSVVLENLERIKKVGPSQWLEEQDQRWACSCCWSRHSWYDERCAECGALLYDCRCEADDLEKW